MSTHWSTVVNLPLQDEIPDDGPTSKKNKKKYIVRFFKSLHPANWFQELSNISITLEEFETIKK